MSLTAVSSQVAVADAADEVVEVEDCEVSVTGNKLGVNGSKLGVGDELPLELIVPRVDVVKLSIVDGKDITGSGETEDDIGREDDAEVDDKLNPKEAMVSPSVAVPA